MVALNPHSPIRINGMVHKLLNTRTTLPSSSVLKVLEISSHFDSYFLNLHFLYSFIYQKLIGLHDMNHTSKHD
jgi:hypothetical protein